VIVRCPAQSSKSRALSGGGCAHGESAGLQNRLARKIPVRHFQTRAGPATSRGYAERTQIPGEHRRARLPDKSATRRRIPRSRKQGSRAVAISGPGNGAPGTGAAVNGESARRSLWDVTSRTRTDNKRSKPDHDANTIAS